MVTLSVSTSMPLRMPLLALRCYFLPLVGRHKLSMTWQHFVLFFVFFCKFLPNFGTILHCFVRFCKRSLCARHLGLSGSATRAITMALPLDVPLRRLVVVLSLINKVTSGRIRGRRPLGWGWFTFVNVAMVDHLLETMMVSNS